MFTFIKFVRHAYQNYKDDGFYSTPLYDEEGMPIDKLKSGEKLIITADEAQKMMDTAKITLKNKNRDRIFGMIRQAIKRGSVKTTVQVGQMVDNIEFFEGLGFTVTDIVPANRGNNGDLLFDNEGMPTNIPYHYYEITWANETVVPIINEA